MILMFTSMDIDERRAMIPKLVTVQQSDGTTSKVREYPNTLKVLDYTEQLYHE